MREDIKKLDSNQFVFITGVAGFIGFSLSRMLLEQGVPVIGYDNLNSYYEPELKYARLTKLEAYDNFTFIKGNLEQQPIINQLFEQYKPKIVVHLAAQAGVRYSIEKPEEYIQSNILGFFNVLEACRQYPVEHFIFASSSSVYGANEKVPSSTEDKTDCPISLYAATKKSNELMAYTYSHLYNIPATGLRFFTVYGPYGRPDMAYFLFTKAILNEQPIQVYNNGNLYRDFTYIDDVVTIMEKILNTPPIADENKVRYKVYNIGNSKPEKLLYFIETIEKALGKKAQKEYLPMQPGDVYQTFADIHDAVRDFGYSPSTSIEVGLKLFVEWYKDYYNALDFVPPLAAECEDI